MTHNFVPGSIHHARTLIRQLEEMKSGGVYPASVDGDIRWLQDVAVNYARYDELAECADDETDDIDV